MFKKNIRLEVEREALNNRSWKNENKGTGISKSESQSVLTVRINNQGGVEMPVPVRFQFNIPGAEKPNTSKMK